MRNRSSSKPMYVSLIAERTKTAPRGLFGGGDGMRPKFEMEDGRRSIQKASTSSKPGERLIVRAHGGGGYGDPPAHAAAIADDLINEYVGASSADGMRMRQAAPLDSEQEFN